MAERRPLVTIGGQVQELPTGDTLPPAGVVAPVTARIRRSTNQAIATGTTYSDLVYDVAGYQVNGAFWSSGTTVTIPETGYYSVAVEATFDGAGLVGTITANMQILVNGTAVIGDDEKQVLVNATAALWCYAQRSFTAGDTIKVQVKHSNAMSVNLLAQGDHSPDIILTKLTGAKGDVGVSSPASGATTQIQYNAAGAFAGDADLTWDATGNTLGLSGVNTGIEIAAITAEPATPAAGKARLYFKSIAGRMSLKSKGPSGLDSNYQTAVWGNTQYRWTMTSALAGIWQNTVGSGAGTFTTALPTTTSLYTTIRRSLYANVVTTLQQVLGQRITENLFFRGAVAGHGGFFFAARTGFDVWTNGARFFAGMHTATTVISADPSALNNTVGFCVDAADNGAISFLTRGTVATKAATGFTIVSGKGYDLFIYCASNSAQYSWRIVDINAGTEASGVATLNLPTNTVTMAAGVLASNAALATVTAVNLAVNGIYVETDY